MCPLNCTFTPSKKLVMTLLIGKIGHKTEFFYNFAVCNIAKIDNPIMTDIKRSRNILLLLAALLVSLPTLVACGSDDDDDDEIYSYSTSTQTTLVQAFGLQADADVLASLDSVHFTVDYDNGLIYNADSLPVGTDISALKVTVEFLNTVSSAVFTITGASTQGDTTINYTSSMSKSIDFTGKTVLTVTSADETQVKDYEVKVLVHQVNPDSLVWPLSWRRDLPGYRGSAIGYKAVKQGDRYCIMTYNGSESVLWTAETPDQVTWDRQVVSLPFKPQIPTLTAADDVLYMLDGDGLLYASADGVEWDACGVTWHAILGSYDDRVLGVMRGQDGYYHDEYPRPQGFAADQVEDGFPVEHASNMIQASNNWTVAQQAVIVGGIDSQGNMLNNVWGYDGARWGKINSVHSNTLPALADATLFSYYSYRTLSGVRRYGLQTTWYLMGGKQADGTLNGTIYLSNTQGVTWTRNDSVIAQPAHMPKFYGAQAFVNYETLPAGGASLLPRRVAAVSDTWECPFIYLYGGYYGQGTLLPYRWRGVYLRMTNTPVY